VDSPGAGLRLKVISLITFKQIDVTALTFWGMLTIRYSICDKHAEVGICTHSPRVVLNFKIDSEQNMIASTNW
jgi:hypothetical protein